MKFHVTPKGQGSNWNTLSHHSSVNNTLCMKMNAKYGISISSKNSESNYSCNSVLSQHNNEDPIPFIDEDEVYVRPNCGRAYLNMPSCDSLSKIVNCFDPFVDKVCPLTDDSSPDIDLSHSNNKIKEFQSEISSKTLDKNTKISAFKDIKGKGEKGKLAVSHSDIIDSAKKSLFLNNRDSYPSCCSIKKFQENIIDNVPEVQGIVSEDVMSPKTIGKATVVYQPSISKLKALSEKMSISSPNCPNMESSKCLVFRNNLHHVGRSDSAPPSLDFIDKRSASERESIFNMVTRKFRSSSLQTEKEIESKQFDKNLNRRSATEAVTGGIIALTRTMSLSLKKTLKSYSPAKMKQEIFNRSSSMTNTCGSIVGSYTQKSPDPPRGNSMWYDKASLTSAIAIVKPTWKLEDPTDSTSVLFKTSSNAKRPDKSTTNETHFSYVTKPAKRKDFFYNLNRKDSATQWYNDSYADVLLSSENNISDTVSNSGNANSPMKCTGKVFPFLPQAPWKRLGQKSPSSPDSTKYFNKRSVSSNSTFYTRYFETSSSTVGLSTEKADTEVHECSVPQEITPLDPNTLKNSLWPLRSVSSSTFDSPCSEKFDDNSLLNKDDICSANNELTLKIHDIKRKDGMIKHSTNAELLKNESDKKTETVSEVRPAIPKKMVLGRNESLQISPFKKEPETHLTSVQLVRQVMASSKNMRKSRSEIKSPGEQNMQSNATTEKKDLYINVNIKTKNNIEQIENTLRKTPRGAIIDLTSRESYSMEDELVNAIDQLSESSEKVKISTSKLDDNKKNEVIGAECNTKFPVYEVIWPEHPYVLVQKSKSSSKVPLTYKNMLTDQNTEILYNQNKTGLCYSPPLRQNLTANMPLAKSQSCNNLDWSESCDLFMNLKELSIAPTKRLVNKTDVELNTLLNQLTTKPLSKNIDFVNNKKQKSTVVKEIDGNRLEATNIEPNETIVHSVTLVTKLDNAGSSHKEEEIVFHFPPPPHILPPPKNESHVESFSIVHKDGCLVINDNDPSFRAVSANEKDDSRLIHNELSENSLNKFKGKNIGKRIPQPILHKSKQSGALRRSSSYSNIMPPGNRNNGNENVFFEKYFPSSWLQIKTDSEESCIHDRVVPFQKSPNVSQSLNAKKSSYYVNIRKMNCDVQKPHKANMETFIEAKTLKSKEIVADVNISNNQVSGDKSKLPLVETKDSDSVYGKICTISVDNIKATEKPAQNIREVKKKLAISKKTERAPLPPNVKPSENVINEIVSKTNSYVMPKKLPSRKSEKAPPPPYLLQNSSLHINKVEEKSKLPAVHENLPNISHISQIVNKNVDLSVVPNKFAKKRLSHSKSDVSVYCTLKEHRIQSTNQEQKVLNMKSLLMNKKTNVDSMNVCSSDSDISYERICPTKNDESAKSVPKYVSKDQIYQTSANFYKRETPVPPPRSKRRSTMEVHYSNAKLEDGMYIFMSMIIDYPCILSVGTIHRVSSTFLNF